LTLNVVRRIEIVALRHVTHKMDFVEILCEQDVWKIKSRFKNLVSSESSLSNNDSVLSPGRRLSNCDPLLSSINDGTRGGWVVSVTPRPLFAPEERTPGNHWTGCWVGLRAGRDTEATEKLICRDRTPVVQSVVWHHTDWTTPPSIIRLYNKWIVRFEVIMVVSMVLFFWALTPCRLVSNISHRFGWTHPFRSSFEDGGSMFLRTLVSTGKSARRYNPEDQELHRRENLTAISE
jgi:hypothetical protein